MPSLLLEALEEWGGLLAFQHHGQIPVQAPGRKGGGGAWESVATGTTMP